MPDSRQTEITEILDMVRRLESARRVARTWLRQTPITRSRQFNQVVEVRDCLAELRDCLVELRDGAGRAIEMSFYDPDRWRNLFDYWRLKAAHHELIKDIRFLEAEISSSWHIPGKTLAPSPIASPLVDEKHPSPPIGACFLLDLLLSKADRAVLPGDLEEEFTTSVLPRYGVRGARFWFWTRTVSTIATRNPICRWVLVGGLVRIGEWIFRKIGS
jgi:hypothetical protein